MNDKVLTREKINSLPHHSWNATGNDMFRCAKCGLVKQRIRSLSKNVYYRDNIKVENKGCVTTK
jgi:hypothetical protein